ncbi:MAG: glycosyltransferase [Hyphomicrobiaceae bacterium]
MAWCAAVTLFLSFSVHAGTALLAWRRCRRPATGSPNTPRRASKEAWPVSVIVPVTNLADIETSTLLSAFRLSYPDYELIFCCPDARDPAVAYLKTLMAHNRAVPARLLVGRSKTTVNPKLDNLEKGWLSARHERIIVADSNLLMPSDFLDRMLELDSDGVGLVSSPPIGCLPQSFAADVECGFLNTCQARWLLASDSLGFGFGHGKAMLLKRSLIERGGGLNALTRDVAEDMAATKFVHKAGLGVRIVDRPFFQPLGVRTLGQVWHRQLRWAQLRRQSVPGFFAAEIVATGLPAAAAGLVLAQELRLSGVLAMVLVLACYHSVEGRLARSAGWPLCWRSPIAWLVRDIMMSIIWIIAWKRKTYSWRGNAVDMSRVAAKRGP